MTPPKHPKVGEIWKLREGAVGKHTRVRVAVYEPDVFELHAGPLGPHDSPWYELKKRGHVSLDVWSEQHAAWTFAFTSGTLFTVAQFISLYVHEAPDAAFGPLSFVLKEVTEPVPGKGYIIMSDGNDPENWNAAYVNKKAGTMCPFDDRGDLPFNPETDKVYEIVPNTK